LFGVTFDPSGDVIYAGDSTGEIRRWRRSRRAAMAPLSGHTDGVCGLAMRADGSTLASASLDGTVRLWNVRAARSARVIRIQGARPSDVAFDPRGDRVAVADDAGWVSLRDEGDGRELARFRAHEEWINRLAWSPDGRRIATASDDRTVRVFQDDGAELERILRVTGIPLAVGFGEGGDHLLVHDVEDVIRVRIDTEFDSLAPAELLRRAEARAGMQLDGLELVAP
jgi:WD40 repeat protein